MRIELTTKQCAIPLNPTLKGGMYPTIIIRGLEYFIMEDVTVRCSPKIKLQSAIVVIEP